MNEPSLQVNKAVYFVLHSKCDTTARDHIKALQLGTVAILALQQKLAQMNTTEMHRSFRKFLNIHQGFKEPISDFIDRFTKTRMFFFERKYDEYRFNRAFLKLNFKKSTLRGTY